MIKRSLPLLFVLLLPLAAADAGRRAVTHEDVWLMRRVGSPVASPDGTRVVFSVTMPAYEAKAQTSDLWIVPVDGSAEPRQITHDKATESGVAWSPDSARIAFSAKREGDEAAQIYVIDLARRAALDAFRADNVALNTALRARRIAGDDAASHALVVSAYERLGDLDAARAARDEARARFPADARFAE